MQYQIGIAFNQPSVRRTRFQALLTKIGDCKYFFLIEEVMEVSFSGH